ncbi:MAG: sigma-70 family RNA polymerase sigma factor [candidate division Zixibacteria bacterium]|nr:sigma-70 family RNA polymerase sigma factor [candidate division Zixibacteria bacterium]
MVIANNEIKDLNKKTDKQRQDEERAEKETREIIIKIKDGDKTAFAKLVKLYHNQVASLAYKMVGDYDEAADIAQDVFVKTNQNIWRYDETKKFYTWLYRITINASIDYKRKHKRHYHESIDRANSKADDKFATPELSFQRGQIRQYIDEATEGLNEKQRSAFVLRDVDGFNINDVADTMNMPVATVRWYLHRARALVKKDLLRKCPHLLLALGFK